MIFDILKDFFTRVDKADYNELQENIQLLIPEYLADFFDTLGFSNVWAKIVKNTPRKKAALVKALHTYCDGFFILKFCHYAEEKYPELFARQELEITDDLAGYLENLRKLDRRRFV